MATPNVDHKHQFNAAASPELIKLQGGYDRVSFTDVTFRNFALKANINRLQMFCDNYLNFADDRGDNSGHYFKAAAPYVTLSILNYGKMATESENLGCFAQHEVLFSVPIEWYKVDKKTKQLVFHDWAYICPFIYVDNDQSLGVGREVYGWSKVRAWLQPVTTSWGSDPRLPRKLLSLATEIFPDLYKGNSQVPRTFIEVVQDAPPSLFRSPFGADDPHNPWWSASRNMRRAVSSMYDMFEFMSGLPIFGYDRSRNFGTISRMTQRLMGNAIASAPWIMPGNDTLSAARNRSVKNPASPCMNNMTMKQFRDAQEPHLACYQALVNSEIRIERLGDMGLLGGPNLMMGDTTGGYRVHVHEYAEQPIVETLGLEVTDTLRDEYGTKVAVLSPLLPNWMACDLRYDMGTTLSWRTKNSLWSDTSDVPPDRKDNKRNRYNTTRGAAMQDSVGPFHYPDTTMRVLPLLADKKRLQEFCDEVISNLKADQDDDGFEMLVEVVEKQLDSSSDHSKNHYDLKHTESVLREAMGIDKSGAPKTGPGTKQSLPLNIGQNHFEPLGSSVYMVITTFGEQYGKMYSEQNNIGQTARREVAFFMPVKWYSVNDKNEVSVRVAILTPYVFCESMRHALTESEVNGRPAVHCRIDSGDGLWLHPAGPDTEERTLATLDTLLMPAMNVGQAAENRRLIEVQERDINETRTGSKSTTEEEIAKMSAEGMFNSFARNQSPIDFIVLKQYRSATEIDKHCYQAIVMVRKLIDKVYTGREEKTRNTNKGVTKSLPRDPSKELLLHIHDYPSLPIVKQLGLKVEKVDSTGDTVIQHIRPVGSFFLRASMKEDVGINLYSRIRGQEWQQESKEIDAANSSD